MVSAAWATTRAASPSTVVSTDAAPAKSLCMPHASVSPERRVASVSTTREPSVSAATGSSGRSAKPLWRRGSSSAAASSWGRSSDESVTAAAPSSTVTS